jgi:hypothetical protein
MWSHQRLLRLATSLWLIGLCGAPLAAQTPLRPAGDEKDPPASPSPPGEPPPPAAEPLPEFTVRGGERLAWEQPAVSSDALTGLTFRLYVDGTQFPLDDAGCVTSDMGPDGFACQASLPSLDPGVHHLWMVTLAPDGFSEGPASSPIVIRVEASGSTTAREGRGSVLSPQSSSAMTVRDDAPAAASLAGDLDDPTDLAVLPDGRMLVAERSGRVRLFRDGAFVTAPALTLSDVVVGEGHGLLAMAVDRDFAATQAVFVLYSSEDGLRAVRYRLSGDTLVGRAIIVEGLPGAAVQPRAVLRMGPDRQLYFALDDGGIVSRAGDLGDLAGKVLRLNADGTTPADLPPGPPIHMTGLHRPTGLAWGPSGELWLADFAPDGSPHLLRAATTPPAGTRAPVARFALPPSDGAHALAVDARAPAAAGTHLLVAHGPAGASLLRVAFAPTGEFREAAWLPAEGGDAPLRAIAVTADGSVFACTTAALVRLDLRGR